jgi:uncharacterized protein YbcI
MTMMMNVGFLMIAFVSNLIKNHNAENENLLGELAVKLVVEIDIASTSVFVVFCFLAVSFFALKENLK